MNGQQKKKMIEVVKLVEQGLHQYPHFLTNEENKIFGDYKTLLQTNPKLFDAIYIQALDELEA